MTAAEELEGTTLRVYVILVNENKPLGPRELARKANLSSPSVAYRHLQKLEELKLVEQDHFGGYTVKQRKQVRGYFLVGRKLFLRPVFYSFFFIGILSIELPIAVARVLIGEVLQYDFLMLTFVTVMAAVLFLVEGLFSRLH